MRSLVSALALGSLLALVAPAGAAVRLHAGAVASLTIEGRQAALRPAGADALRLVDAATGRGLQRVPLRGADLAHVSGPRLATITYQSPDSNRLLDASTLRLALLRRPGTSIVTDRSSPVDARVWSALLGRAGLVVATRDRYEPSSATPDCLEGGPCEWVRTGAESFVFAPGATTRRALPAGRVLDADGTHVLVLAGRELLTTTARGAVVARSTLPASLSRVRYGRLGAGERILLIAPRTDGDAAILLRRGRPVWTGSIAADAPPSFAGSRIVWGTGPRVWLRDVRTPSRRAFVARCPVAVSAVAVSAARVAWVCRGRGAAAWATVVR